MISSSFRCSFQHTRCFCFGSCRWLMSFIGSRWVNNTRNRGSVGRIALLRLLLLLLQSIAAHLTIPPSLHLYRIVLYRFLWVASWATATKCSFILHESLLASSCITLCYWRAHQQQDNNAGHTKTRSHIEAKNLSDDEKLQPPSIHPFTPRFPLFKFISMKGERRTD